MSRLLAWLRYRGWRNVYWREDWAHATCSHSCNARYSEAFQSPNWATTTGATNTTITIDTWSMVSICVDCGAVLGGVPT